MTIDTKCQPTWWRENLASLQVVKPRLFIEKPFNSGK